MVFSWQEYWSGLPCPTPIDHTLWECFTMICHLSWPCMAWLIAPLSYTSPLAMTRLWPMKGSQCFWIVVLKKTLESPLDCKEIKPVHPKGNQSWIFIGRTGAPEEVEYRVPANGYQVSSGMMKNVLLLVMVVQLCGYNKTHCIVYFKMYVMWVISQKSYYFIFLFIYFFCSATWLAGSQNLSSLARDWICALDSESTEF